MRNGPKLPAALTGAITGVVLTMSLAAWAQPSPKRSPAPPHDAIAEVQTPRTPPEARLEQKKTEHDRADLFSAANAPPSSTALAAQPDQGKVLGFDFYRDPLNS